MYTLFIANSHGIDLSWQQQLGILAILLMTSKGAATVIARWCCEFKEDDAKNSSAECWAERVSCRYKHRIDILPA